MVEVLAGIGAFKALYDSAKALKDMNDAAVRNAAVIDLQEKILAAQAAQMSLIERVHAAEEKARGFETWETQKQRYELKDLGYGALAYMLKPEVRGTEPAHWVCTNCFGNGRASIIQYALLEGFGYRHMCPACKANIDPAPASMAGSKAKWFD